MGQLITTLANVAATAALVAVVVAMYGLGGRD